MKVLLINPYFDFKKFGRFQMFMEPMPCLGLAYIAAVLEKHNIEVDIIDAFALRLEQIEVLKRIKDSQPDVVGISCLTPSVPIVISIARAIKQFNNKIIVALGNIHADIFAGQILSNEGVDVVVHGEGEYAMLDLVRATQEKTCFSQINGISFSNNGQIIKTEPRELIADLDSLPYPAWHLFPYKKYGFLPFANLNKPVLSLLSSKGCPYRCSFCSFPSTGNRYRRRVPRKVVDEIENLIENFHVKQVGFVDPIFSLYKNDNLEFCREIIRRGLNEKIVWICETRVDLMDKELLQTMRKAGCKKILYGIETGTQNTLDNVRKEFNLNSVERVVKDTKCAGIQTVGLFMLGFPGETKEMIQQTIDFARKIELDFAKFAITIPFPGSQLYEDLTKSGRLKRQDWENFISFNSDPERLVCISNRIKPEELIDAQRQAHIGFYLRPKIIFRHLFKIRTIKIKDLLIGLFSLLLSWRKNR